MINLHRYIALVLGLLFILFAVFQYNDPDPLVWISIYGLAALISFGVFVRKFRQVIFIITGLAALAGAIFFWPAEYYGITLNPAHKFEVEHARESLGLGICFVVMLYYFLVTK